LARFRPQLVHAHHDRSARVAGRWAPVPVLATIHMRYTERDFGRCNALVALTEDARARTLAAGYQREVALIPNWVLPWKRPDATRIAALRAEFGIGPDEFVVGSIGRLEPIKRMGGLIAAFAEAALPAAHLLIVGEGEQRVELERQIATLGLRGRVHLAGFRADARDFYAAFDRFVLNSEHDPYPLVLLEAAEQGCRIIATSTQGGAAIARTHDMTLAGIDAPAELVAALRAAYAARADTGHTTPGPRLTGHDTADRLPDLLALYRRMVGLDGHG
jgi:glycosyltransferase involved in cell wall biosynthesis